jgi:hypothetical protein
MPRLIPFIYNSGTGNTQSAVLVLGDGLMSVVIDGHHVLSDPYAITAITNADPCRVTAAGNDYVLGETIVIQAPGGMPQLDDRQFQLGSTGDSFDLASIIGGSIDSTNYGIYTSGGTVFAVYTIAIPWADTNLLPNTETGEPGIKYSQSADVITVTHPSYPPYQIARNGANNDWTITEISFGATTATPTLISPSPATVPTAPSTGFNFTSGYQYFVTAISANGMEESLPQAFPTYAQATSGPTAGGQPPTMGLYTGVYVTVSWDPVYQASGYNVYRCPEIAVSPGDAVPLTESLFGLIGAAQGNTYVDQNGVPDFSLTPPQQSSLFENGAITAGTVVSGGAAYNQYLTTITVVTSTGYGALLYPVVSSGGEITDVVVVRGGVNYSSGDTLIANGSGTGFSGTIDISELNDYPGACAYYQQRLFFAGSYDEPANLWASQTGNYSNFNTSAIVRDTDAITATLAAGGANTSEQVNLISHLVPMNVGMVALTPGGAYQITGGGPNTAITPASIQALPQAYSGSSDVRPIAINYDLIANSARGNEVSAIRYNFWANIFAAVNISYMSNHLFYGNYVVDWCYAEQPWRQIWACRDDGTFLSCSYLAEQEIFAWARHDTNGQVISMCSIPEGTENAIYMIVQRILNGNTYYCIERMFSRYMGEDPALNVQPQPENARFLDCAIESIFTYLDATVTASAATGNNVALTLTDGDGFTDEYVGEIVRIGGGIGIITSVFGSTLAYADFTGNSGPGRAIQALTPNSGYSVDNWGNPVTVATVPSPQTSGNWSIGTNVTQIYNLDHLEGQAVWALLDGSVVYNLTVSGGSVTFPIATSSWVVGMPYQCQLQPLRLSSTQAPIEGKKKIMGQYSVLEYETRGLKVGPSFSQLQYLDQLTSPLAENAPAPLQSKMTQRNNFGPYTDVSAYTCFQVDDPLPGALQLVAQDYVVGDGPP